MSGLFNSNAALTPKLQRIDTLQREIDSFRPLEPSELSQLRQYYKIGLTYTSNALEGNSLTETETKVVIEDGLTISGKPLRDHFEALGHAKAIDYIFSTYTNFSLSESVILSLHRHFFESIDAQNAGRYRSVQVFVSGSSAKFPKPDEISIKMSEWMSAYHLASTQTHPALLAAHVHKHLVRVHPFVDGNGRTARLLMNLVLLHFGYPIVCIPPILRVQYLEALHASDAGDDLPFLTFICDQVIEAQKDRIRL